MEELYDLCSEYKGADQLRSHREADQRLCFRICKKRFSHNAAHNIMFNSFAMSARNLENFR